MYDDSEQNDFHIVSSKSKKSQIDVWFINYNTLNKILVMKDQHAPNYIQISITSQKETTGMGHLRLKRRKKLYIKGLRAIVKG